MSELQDFEPTTGHRRDCPATWEVGQTHPPECDCAVQLYVVAAQAGEALSGMIAGRFDAVGPVSRDHVLVLRGVTPADDEVWNDMIEPLTSYLHELFGETTPLVLFLALDASIEAFDEEAMRVSGWVRADRKEGNG